MPGRGHRTAGLDAEALEHSQHLRADARRIVADQPLLGRRQVIDVSRKGRPRGGRGDGPLEIAQNPIDVLAARPDVIPLMLVERSPA